jgi:hypothetical protein
VLAAKQNKRLTMEQNVLGGIKKVIIQIQGAKNDLAQLKNK